MRRDPHSAFTLLEILVSVAIGTTVAAMAWTGFYQTRQLARRNEIETALAVDAAQIYRLLADQVSGLHPGMQMRLERTAISGSAYPAGSYRISMTWLRGLSSQNPANGMGDLRKWSEYRFEDVWTRWEWRPPLLTEPTSSSGCLLIGSTSPMNRSKAFDLTVFPDLTGSDKRTIFTAVQGRRDRRRDLDDNDLRLMPNAALHPAVRLSGDALDLVGEDINLNRTMDPGEDRNGNGVLDPGTLRVLNSRVSALVMQWVDHGGWTTTVSASDGVVVQDDGGAARAHPGKAWWNADLRVVDGLYRDGRSDAAGSDTGRNVRLDAPAVIRLSMTMTDPASGVSRSFTFSIPVGLDGPAGIGL